MKEEESKKGSKKLKKPFQVGKNNVLKIPIVKADNIILPPLRLKLGYMKQFVKRLGKGNEAFSTPKISISQIEWRQNQRRYVQETLCPTRKKEHLLAF